MGAEGRSAVRYLRDAGHTNTLHAISDEPVVVDDPDLKWWTGEQQTEGLDHIDILIRSPGFPPHHPTLIACINAKVTITTTTNLVIAELRNNQLPIIGVTGSKGKSTTVTLIHQMLDNAGIPNSLVGNIGLPALEALDDIIEQRKVTVFEMSSYQCHDLVLGPTIAVLLDLFPEHMDWHGDTEAYIQAKLKIASTQRPGDQFIFNNHSRCWEDSLGPGTAINVNHPDGLHYRDQWFREGKQKLCDDQLMYLRGEHQRRNAISAFSAARLLGATPDDLEAILSTFQGLPHRMQDLGVVRGIRWFDDAISTAPQAAAAALCALGDEAGSIIVGGMDRGYDFAPLATAIADSHLDAVIVMPDSGSCLVDALKDTDIAIEHCENLEIAVNRASALTLPGRACLFSPASPSYNQFRNFEQRGDRFIELVLALRHA